MRKKSNITYHKNKTIQKYLVVLDDFCLPIDSAVINTLEAMSDNEIAMENYIHSLIQHYLSRGES